MGASLERAVHHGDDIEARSNMLLGSMLAGQAFANSPVAAVHALAYPIGGHFHVPHGLSNALVLPHVLRFNAKVAPQPYAELAPLAFPDLGELEGQARAEAFCDALAEPLQALRASADTARDEYPAGRAAEACPRRDEPDPTCW